MGQGSSLLPDSVCVALYGDCLLPSCLYLCIIVRTDSCETWRHLEIVTKDEKRVFLSHRNILASHWRCQGSFTFFYDCDWDNEMSIETVLLPHMLLQSYATQLWKQLWASCVLCGLREDTSIPPPLFNVITVFLQTYGEECERCESGVKLPYGKRSVGWILRNIFRTWPLLGTKSKTRWSVLLQFWPFLSTSVTCGISRCMIERYWTAEDRRFNCWLLHEENKTKIVTVVYIMVHTTVISFILI